jgi:hypothetical protein
MLPPPGQRLGLAIVLFVVWADLFLLAIAPIIATSAFLLVSSTFANEEEPPGASTYQKYKRYTRLNLTALYIWPIDQSNVAEEI